jgi:hypothetical protein
MRFRLLPVVALLACAAPGLAQRAPGRGPVNLPAAVLSQACAPALAFELPPAPLRVTGSQEAKVRTTMSPGDLITINAGSDNGIEVGQRYFARRPIPLEKRDPGRDNPLILHTAGWILVYAVDDRMSLATIEHACDAVQLGDYLEPFAIPAVPAQLPGRPAAQRSNYGHVLSGTDNRLTFGTGEYVMVDRGSDHGVALGAQFVVYRDKLEPGNFLFELADAVAVDVRPETTTLRVTRAIDGVRVGDYVALRK